MLDILEKLHDCLTEMRDYPGFTPSKTKYFVEVTETRKKIIEIEMPAGSFYEAKDSVAEMYKSGEVKLDRKCIKEVEISVSETITVEE